MPRERELPAPLAACARCLVADRANLEASVRRVSAKRRLTASVTAEQILTAEWRVPSEGRGASLLTRRGVMTKAVRHGAHHPFGTCNFLIKKGRL